MKVFKYPLRFGHQRLDLPTFAEILHVAMQGDHLFLWARVSDDVPVEARYFAVVGTGFDAPPGVHRGTVLDSGFVWHVFETAGIS